MSGELTGDLISNWINFKLYPESVEDTFFSPDILLSCVPSGYLCVGSEEVTDFLKHFFDQNGPDARVEIVASKMDIQENLLIEDIKVIVTPLRSTLPWLFSPVISTDLSAQKFTYGLKMTLQFYENALVKVKLDWDQTVLDNQIKSQEPIVSSEFQAHKDTAFEQLKESNIEPAIEPSSVVSANPHIPESPVFIDEELLLEVDQASLKDTESAQDYSQAEFQNDLISDDNVTKSISLIDGNTILKENLPEHEEFKKSVSSELDSHLVTEIPAKSIVSEQKVFSDDKTLKSNYPTENVASTDIVLEKIDVSKETPETVLPIVQPIPVVTSVVDSFLPDKIETLISKEDKSIEKVSSPDVEQAEVNTLVDSEGSNHGPSTQDSPISQSPLFEPKPASKLKKALSNFSSKAQLSKTTVKNPTSTVTPIAKSQSGLNKDVQHSQTPLGRSKSYHRGVTATSMTKSQSSPNKNVSPPQKPLARGLSYHRSITASPFSASRRPISQNSYNPSESRSKIEARTLLPIPPLSRNRKFDTRRFESQIDFTDGSSAPTLPLSPKFSPAPSSPSPDSFVSRTPRSNLTSRNLQTSFSIGAENSNSNSSQSSQMPGWANELRPYLNKGSTGFKI